MSTKLQRRIEDLEGTLARVKTALENMPRQRLWRRKTLKDYLRVHVISRIDKALRRRSL